jgi:uncharacterized membrane protein
LERKTTPDLIKGIAVVLMVQVHLMELFAMPGIYFSTAGKISLFLGGPPAAPIFMAVMGYFLAFSGKGTSNMVFRGLKLLLWGFLLNIGMNFHLIYDYFTQQLLVNPFEYLFGVDILFLAGLSLMIIGLLKPLFKNNIYLWGGLALLIVGLTPLLNDHYYENPVLNYLMAYIGGSFRWSYFPVFPWLAYPLIGYCFSLIEKPLLSKILVNNRLYTWLGITGVIIAFTISKAADLTHQLEQYYHHGMLFFLWTTLFIAFWAALFMLLNKRFHENMILRYLRWTGKNVTRFYVFQWLIIGNLGTYLYQSQNLWQLGIWFAFVMLVTSLLVFAWSKYRDQQNFDVL